MTNPAFPPYLDYKLCFPLPRDRLGMSTCDAAQGLSWCMADRKHHQSPPTSSLHVMIGLVFKGEDKKTFAHELISSMFSIWTSRSVSSSGTRRDSAKATYLILIVSAQEPVSLGFAQRKLAKVCTERIPLHDTKFILMSPGHPRIQLWPRFQLYILALDSSSWTGSNSSEEQFRAPSLYSS